MRNTSKVLRLSVVAGFIGCLVLSVSPLAVAADPASTPALDFGDFGPSTIRVKASTAFAAKDYEAAIGYADKCIELFGKDALAQQAALTAPPTEKDVIFKQWALNDVGTAYLTKGQALEALNKKTEAIEAYKTLVEKLAFAQCWDPQGWFWIPADQAKERLAALASS